MLRVEGFPVLLLSRIDHQEKGALLRDAGLELCHCAPGLRSLNTKPYLLYCYDDKATELSFCKILVVWSATLQDFYMHMPLQKRRVCTDGCATQLYKLISCKTDYAYRVPNI